MAEIPNPPAETPSAAPSGGPRADQLDVDSLIGKYFADPDPTPVPAPTKAKAEPAATMPDTLPGPPTGDTSAEPVMAKGDTPAGDPEEDGQTEATPQEPVTPAAQLEIDDEVEALLLATEDETEGGDEEEEKEGEVQQPEESFLPEFDRAKFLKDYPELEKPYRHMQAAWTRAHQQVAKLRRESEEKIERASTMEQQYNQFHEMLSDDGRFTEFLVQVSLGRPEVIEQAYERAVALHEDEGKKDAYQQKLELEQTKQQLKEREQREEATRVKQRTTEIIGLTHRVAGRLGLKGKDDLALAEEFVAKQILQNHANTGKRDVTSEEIVMAVRRAATILGRKSVAAHTNGKKEAQQQQLKAQQDRLREPARPAPPQAAAPSVTPTGPKRIDNAPKQPAIDSWIDQQLGVGQ